MLLSTGRLMYLRWINHRLERRVVRLLGERELRRRFRAARMAREHQDQVV